MGTVGRLPDFHRILIAKCMPLPCDEAPPEWAGQMEAIRRQDPGGREEQDPPWKAPQACARDDEISPDANRSSWRRFSTESSMDHVHRAGSVGRRGDRGARGPVAKKADRRQDAVRMGGVEGRASPGRATWCALSLVLRHTEDAGFVVPASARLVFASHSPPAGGTINCERNLSNSP